jgi:hypothetical protein
MSKNKGVSVKEKKTPGAIMAEEIRVSSNKLTNTERKTLLADAPGIIFSKPLSSA